VYQRIDQAGYQLLIDESDSVEVTSAPNTATRTQLGISEESVVCGHKTGRTSLWQSPRKAAARLGLARSGVMRTPGRSDIT
jgi:hypothetical protein